MCLVMMIKVIFIYLKWKKKRYLPNKKHFLQLPFILGLIEGTFLHTVLEMAETDSDLLSLHHLVPQSSSGFLVCRQKYDSDLYLSASLSHSSVF